MIPSANSWRLMLAKNLWIYWLRSTWGQEYSFARWFPCRRLLKTPGISACLQPQRWAHSGLNSSSKQQPLWFASWLPLLWSHSACSCSPSWRTAWSCWWFLSSPPSPRCWTKRQSVPLACWTVCQSCACCIITSLHVSIFFDLGFQLLQAILLLKGDGTLFGGRGCRGLSKIVMERTGRVLLSGSRPSFKLFKNCMTGHSKIHFFCIIIIATTSLPWLVLLCILLHGLKGVIPITFAITIYLFSKDVTREPKRNQLQYSFALD